MPIKKNTKEVKKPYVYKRTSAYEAFDAKRLKKSEEFAQKYMKFLGSSKTERLCVKNGIDMLKKAGFEDIEKIKSTKLEAGKKIFFNYRGKNLFAVIIGKKALSQGFRLIGAHIDSPRIDLKYMPFYESDGFCLLKTHYYGGIKKYQRTTMPLSMIGVAYDKNGKKIDINVGENEKDPVFFLSDLLIHLSKDQMAKSGEKVIEAEEMNLIIGSVYNPAKKESVKDNILKMLFEKYGLTEKSFAGAEIELVPSQKIVEIGFDKSLIGGYGHDDRSCAFPALASIADKKNIPEYTSIVYWSDKEEIGSVGATGAQSRTLQYLIEKLYSIQNKNFSMLDIEDVFFRSKAISSDVSTLLDPNFKGVYDTMNTALANHGVIIEKYTGARGKSGANDCDAEYMQELMTHFDKSKVVYQSGGLGKVDQGGGGTISQFLAMLGVNVVDMGVGVLNMHSPFEVISKTDLFSAYEAYGSFWDLK